MLKVVLFFLLTNLANSMSLLVSSSQHTVIHKTPLVTYTYEGFENVREALFYNKFVVIADSAEKKIYLFQDQKCHQTLILPGEPRSLNIYKMSLYCVLKDANQLVEINLLSGLYEVYPLTGRGPRCMFLFGRHAYITCNESDQLDIFDIIDKKVVKTISTPSQPYSVLADDSFIYLTSIGESSLWAYDLLNDELLFTVHCGAHPTKVIKAEDNLYVTNFDDGTITVISSNDGSLVCRYELGGMPFDVVMHNNHFFVSDHQGGTVTQYTRQFMNPKILLDQLLNPHYINFDTVDNL
ncbi:MAG: hypothetical protein C0425_10080 [Chlorobiaceae bacterium]|nr:hypothetical protein [Chlorobiaceae bacterium]